MASPRIHPTAHVSPKAELADGVEVGAHAFIDDDVHIGPDCVIRPGAYLFGPMTMGRGNTVFTSAILGESAQHLKYKGERTTLEIGDGNVFREGVTIHRGTTHSWKTVIGDNNFLMANSHVGHDSVVGNRCIFANGALVAGHCVISDNVLLSGNAAIHQFMRIGRLAFLSGCSVTTKDMPPFIIQQGINTVVGLNLVGMRRAGMPQAEIEAVRRAFKIIFRERNLMPAALEKMESELGQSPAVREIIDFLSQPGKGINTMRGRFNEDIAA